VQATSHCQPELLGCFLAACGFAASWAVTPAEMNLSSMWVIPLTLVSVVLCGSLVGSCLPLFFQRIGLDPALMSNPFVAGIIDIFGIVLYMTVAWFFLT
jgi:magnesium transporter